MCRSCGKNTFQTRQAFSGHVRCCAGDSSATATTATTIAVSTLLLPSLESHRSKLSDYNFLMTEWIQIVQAGKQSDAVSSHNRRRKTAEADIGIQCLACAKENRCFIGSIKYTDSLEHIPHGVFVMVDRHMLTTCPYMPAQVKEQMVVLKKNSTSQSVSKGRMGLPGYLGLLYQELRLENKGNGQGVVQRATQAKIEEVIAPTPTATLASVESHASDEAEMNGGDRTAVTAIANTLKRHDAVTPDLNEDPVPVELPSQALRAAAVETGRNKKRKAVSFSTETGLASRFQQDMSTRQRDGGSAALLTATTLGGKYNDSVRHVARQKSEGSQGQVPDDVPSQHCRPAESGDVIQDECQAAITMFSCHQGRTTSIDVLNTRVADGNHGDRAARQKPSSEAPTPLEVVSHSSVSTPTKGDDD